MSSLAENHLPKVVDMIADRIGLNYNNIKRKEATEKYIADNPRLDFINLKNSNYSLGEEKTRKASDRVINSVKRSVRNPLKLNARVRKALYKLTPKEKQNLRYADFEKINELWSSYAKTVLSHNDPYSLFRMDLHGCHITCTASKNPTLIGTEGFVIQDTKNTFLVVKKTNKIVTLPKKESIFEFNADGKRYRIHGCNLLFTVQARSKLKYKQRRGDSDV